ncbi:metal-dependent hydrolase [Spirillospora sp. CA-294931]|uniref:metal-dependent hydrolase n=1 Tax=Spirillospora sp. CA-294931 TaxID=3240042 RepID=UPI003D9400E5
MTIVPREVHVRRVAFTHPEGALDRHYVGGDLVMSHVVAVLSATFPPGEDFFIRAVRDHRDQVTDPALKEQIRGFIGQEVVHGREHDHLNQRLRAMGYPTHRIDRAIERLLRLVDRTMPGRVRLGFTAALEHYTATIAERLLSSTRAQALLGETEVRKILLWHALEESEHKAVAFDVFRAVGGTERTRLWTMRVVHAGLFLVLLLGTLRSLLNDRAARNPVRVARSLARLRYSPFLSPKVLANIRAYHRPGFHPDDFDATDLLARWQAELFGPEGTLTPNLK